MASRSSNISYGKENKTMKTLMNGHSTRNKVVFVMGATATGKSKLSIDLAARFNGEVINSDKIQVYKGLDIITNKVTEEEAKGISHHLLGIVDDIDQDFSADDFCRLAMESIDAILRNGKVPIIGGGSNSFVENLVEDPKTGNFRKRFDCCYIWVDVSLPILHKRAALRVDQMVAAGFVDEVRQIFLGDGKDDYSRGIRRAIGVREMEPYFVAEKDENVDEATKQKILATCIDETKTNTIKLIDSQLGNIQRLRNERGWNPQRVDATIVYQKRGHDAEVAWDQLVLKKAFETVEKFLNGSGRTDRHP